MSNQIRNLKPLVSSKFKPILIRYIERSVVLNFDDVPDGTIIDSQYSSSGVTFSNIITPPPTGVSSHIYAREFANIAETPPNVISVFQTGIPCFDCSYGVIQVKFSKYPFYVTLDAQAMPDPEGLGSDDNRPYMEVYDTTNSLMTKIRYPLKQGDTGYGSWQRLTYTNSSEKSIGSIRFSSERQGSNYVYGVFDRLFFSLFEALW